MIHLFGDRLKELRKDKKISQETLGDVCGVAKNTVSNWENNINKPDIDLIAKIAKYFGVSTDYLLGINQEDYEKIERLKVLLKEAGIGFDDDLTIEQVEKAFQIMYLLKEQK